MVIFKKVAGFVEVDKEDVQAVSGRESARPAYFLIDGIDEAILASSISL
jgi:pyrroline-5-carboxylate reductase